MRRLWLALWCATLGFDALLPHLAQPAPGLAVASFLACALLVVTRRVWAAPPPGVAAWLAGGSALAALLLPWPERLGPALVAAGAVAAIPGARRGFWGALAQIPAAVGLLFMLMAALAYAYGLVEARHHDLNAAARVVALGYRALGIPAVSDPPFVHLAGVGNLHTFDCTLEKLIGLPLFLLAGAGIGLLLAVRGRALRARTLIGFGMLVITFAVARALALGFALDPTDRAAIYYERTWMWGGLLPLVALLALVLPPQVRSGKNAPRPAGAAVAGAVAVAGTKGAPSWRPPFDLRPGLWAPALLTGVFLAAAFGFHAPGRRHEGRVLIDERHSRWEWSTVALDTLSYGVQTVYNYSELVRLLGHHYQIGANFAPFTDSLLATTDVLILKTPTRPYDNAEVEAVIRFVRRGGGLWLIGDHTNIFGMSTNLNRVARRFGIRYHPDALIDLTTLGRQLFMRPRLLAHPVVRHVPPLLMATSCSMSGPPGGQPVMIGRSLLADRSDYAVNSFFGDFLPDPSEPFGNMLQSVATTYGRGRVLGFSDSTIFSNFFMFIRGKPELALGSVAWLMQEERWGWARPALIGAALIAFAIMVVVAARAPRLAVIVALATAAVPGFALTARALDSWVSRWSALPAPRSPLPIVAFDRDHTAYHVPDLMEIPDESPHSFHTFYVWTQRVGYMPATRLFERCLDNSLIVVLVNPRAHFTAGEVDRLADYVRRGGGLLVMDSPGAPHSTAAEILAPFGLGFEGAALDSVEVTDASSGLAVATLVRAGRVRGGEAVLRFPDDSTALAVARVGHGRVVALSSESFSDAVLGTTSAVPTPAQLALYRIEYRIFTELLPSDLTAAADAIPGAARRAAIGEGQAPSP